MVRLELGLAAVAADDRGARQVGQVGELGNAGEDRGRRAREPGQRRLLFLGLHVLCADVADLVAQHGRELRLVLHVGQDAARDVDVAALGRKGVDVVGVDDREMPFEVGASADLGEFLADPLHVFLQLQVVVHAHRLDDLGVHRLRLLDLAGRLLRLLDLGFLACGADAFCFLRRGCRYARRARDEERGGAEGQQLAWQLRHVILPVQLRRAGGGKVDRPTPPIYFRPYFLRKRSTRPPESSIFCLPV